MSSKEDDVPTQYACADAIANETTVALGLAALALAAIVIVVALVALVIIIHVLRKDQRKHTSRGGSPVPPDER